jgi:hypothetical protein
MSKTMLAMIAAAVIGTVLLMPDFASARSGGVSASRGGGSGGAFRGSSAAGPRSGLGRRGGAVHGRGSAVGRHGAARGRRHPGFGQPNWTFGASSLDDGVPLYEYAPGLPPNCVVRRVQISDDYGWRVRDMVVCPYGGL